MTKKKKPVRQYTEKDIENIAKKTISNTISSFFNVLLNIIITLLIFLVIIIVVCFIGKSIDQYIESKLIGITARQVEYRKDVRKLYYGIERIEEKINEDNPDARIRVSDKYNSVVWKINKG